MGENSVNVKSFYSEIGKEGKTNKRFIEFVSKNFQILKINLCHLTLREQFVILSLTGQNGFKKCSLEELAELLKVSDNTVKMLKIRALKKLKALYTQNEHEKYLKLNYPLLTNSNFNEYFEKDIAGDRRPKYKEADFIEKYQYADIDEIQNKCKNSRELALKEDSVFVKKLDEILNGKYWQINSLVKYIESKKTLTQVQYDYLFCLYTLERIEKRDSKDSSILAILLLCHDNFIYYIMNKINIPDWTNYDEVKAKVENGLRKAIDSYDITKDIKFITYASSVARNEVLMFLRKNRIVAQSLDKEVDSSGENDQIYDDYLGANDEFIEDYAEKEISKQIWKNIGFLKSRTQFCLMARFGKYTKPLSYPEIASILNYTRPYVYILMNSGIKELKQMYLDSKYLSEKKYLHFMAKSGLHTQVQNDYHILTKEEFNDILLNGLQSNILINNA